MDVLNNQEETRCNEISTWPVDDTQKFDDDCWRHGSSLLHLFGDHCAR